jgi:hypothetical protein
MTGGFGGRLGVALTCVLATVAVAVTDASAQAGGGAPITFDEREPLAFTVKQLRADEVSAEVLNNRSGRRPLRVSVSGLRLKSGDATLPTREVVTWRKRRRVPGSGAVTIRLGAGRLAGATLTPGTYTGHLAVTDARSRKVLHRRLSLTVAGPAAKLPPKPAIASLSITVIKGLVGEDDLDGNTLPLAVPAGTKAEALLLPAAPLRGIVGKEGDVAKVSWAGTWEALTNVDDEIGAQLDIASADDVGEYSGKIDLLPDEDGGDVAVTVTVRHGLWAAFLAILAGLLLGLVLKRYTNVWRVQNNLRSHLVTITGEFDSGRVAFREQVRDDDARRYTISAAFHAEVDAVRAAIGDLSRPWRFWEELNKDAYDDAVARLGTLLEVAKTWGEFGSDLVDLEGKLDAAKKTFAKDPEDRPTPLPKAIETGARELGGRELKLGELGGRRAAVRKSAAWLAKWQTMWELLVEERAWLKNLEVAGGDAAVLAGVRRDLLAAADGLRITKSAEDMEKAEVEATLLKARRALVGETPEGMAAMPHGEKEREAAAAAQQKQAQTAPQATAVRTTIAEVTPSPDDLRQITDRKWGELAQGLRRRRLIGDLAVAALAFAVAMLTGLNELYAGQPFGTFSDYVTAVLWGLGIEGGLALLAGAVGSLGGLPRLQQTITVPQLSTTPAS